MRAPVALGALLLPLAACAVRPLPPTEQARPVPPPPAAVAECKPEPGGRLVGQTLQPSTPEAARIATGARTVRVIAPGTAATMDIRPDRLTIDVDARNRITALRCG